MPKPTTKIIHGRTVNQREFKQAILDAVNMYPDGARAADIVTQWGGGMWDEPEGKHALALTLMNLANGGYLKRVPGARGLFTVTRHGAKGPDRALHFEKEVCKAMIEEGAGIMKRADVEDIFVSESHPRVPHAKANPDRPGIGPRGNSQNRSKGDSMTQAKRESVREDHQFREAAVSNLRRVLKVSSRIRQNTGKTGYYNVTYSQLARVPQPGRNLSMMLRWVGESAAKRAKMFASDSSAEPRDIFVYTRPIIFANIGRVVTSLRELHDLSISDLAAVPSVAAALKKYRGADINRFKDHAKSFQAQWGYDEPPSEAEVYAGLLELYEKGNDALHMAIDADLIVGIAEFFYCDPAYLSMGMVFPDEANNSQDNERDVEGIEEEI